MTAVKILVIEDDQIIARDLETTLASLGYEVVSVASTGEESLLKVEQTCPDVVLMDIVLDGEMDGIDAARDIRSRFNIPIIYVTAYSDKCLLERTQATEPFGYVLKPFKEQELRCAIEMARYKHKMETKLKESEERHRRLYQNTPVMMQSMDRNAKLVSVSDYWLEVLGYERSEVIGRNPTDFQTSASMRYALDVAIPNFLKTGISKDEPLQFVKKNGEVVDVVLNATAERDDKGNIIRSRAVLIDVTEQKRMGEHLRKTQERLDLAIKGSNDAFWDWDIREGHAWISPRYCEMLGHEEADIVPTHSKFLELLHSDDRKRHLDNLQAHFDVSIPYDMELRLKTKSGEYRWFRDRGIAIRDAQGNPVRMSGSLQDIHDRKMAEGALRDSEEQYRAVFENAGIGINVVDLDSRKLTQANRALVSMLGYTEEELRQLTHLDITFPEDREITKQHVDSLMAGDLDSFGLEKRYISKDGTIIWGQLSVSAIRDTEGNPRAAVGMIADITERKKMEIALKESEERLRLIIDSSPIGIMIVQDDTYVYVNPRFAQMFGYETAEEIVGLPVKRIYVPKSKELILQRAADGETGTKIVSHYEATGVTKTGKRVDVATWLTEIDYFGENAILVFLMDVTEAKSVRSQLLQAQKMEAIGNLAGGVAHDFNNILQVVMGFSEITLMGKREGDQEYEDIGKILSSARKGADLVKGLLAFSRKTEINPKPLNLNRQIEQIESILTRTISKTINMELALQDPLSAINADPTQIEQILMNVAINARDAMPEGGRLVFETSNVTPGERYCKAHLGLKPGDYVLLTISDTGEGMDTETLEHIFEPFFSTKPTGEGTGLGLAMVYGIVKQHGGYITCYSKPGVGTTFKLYFPAIEMKAETQVQGDVARFPGGSETILLVDDEAFLRELGERILNRAGYTVLTAANGREALQVYKGEHERISLVILDLIMPEMDGKQCLKELITLNPRAKVLLASGYSASGLTKQDMDRARGFVSKPFDIRQLLQSVREALDSE